MRLVKTEGARETGRNLTEGLFLKVIETLLISDDVEMIREEFVEKYAEVYDDVRYYTFYHVQYVPLHLVRTTTIDRVYRSLVTERKDLHQLGPNALSILSTITPPTPESGNPSSFLLPSPSSTKSKRHPLLSRAAHKTMAQSAWLAVLNASTSTFDAGSTVHLHSILSLLATTVVPWFQRPELLMDFCTDCYSLGGSTALLALSGLFSLMQEKNLDYPDFFPKLYSLLDASLLHSKHRSRFFRLLDTFMSSTHLPAALVASFIKRLSRLALHAPPAGIVMVVPWIYNLLRKHPTCTFMIHRVVPRGVEAAEIDDPFDMQEPDPMRTRALESSLWEIETLQSHYHPNVGMLARIISEQFTKHQYNLEDFLDHSYGTVWTSMPLLHCVSTDQSLDRCSTLN